MIAHRGCDVYHMTRALLAIVRKGIPLCEALRIGRDKATWIRSAFVSMERFGPLASQALQELEHCSLIHQSQGKTSDLMFYTLTGRGLAALGSGEVDKILGVSATG
jgi:hypothetical protein